MQAQRVGLQRSTVLGFVTSPDRSSAETTLVRGETETVTIVERRLAAFAGVPQVRHLRMNYAPLKICVADVGRLYVPSAAVRRRGAVPSAFCGMALAITSSFITTIARLRRGSGPPSCTCMRPSSCSMHALLITRITCDALAVVLSQNQARGHTQEYTRSGRRYGLSVCACCTARLACACAVWQSSTRVHGTSPAGNLLLFSNTFVDGSLDPASLHESQPVSVVGQLAQNACQDPQLHSRQSVP